MEKRIKVKKFNYIRNDGIIHVKSNEGNDITIHLQELTIAQREHLELQLELVIIDINNTLNRKHYIEKNKK